MMLSACSSFSLKNKHDIIASNNKLLETWDTHHKSINNDELPFFSIFPEEDQNSNLKNFIREVLDKNPDLQSIIATAQAAKHSHSQAKGYTSPQADLSTDKNHLNSDDQKTIKTVRATIKTSWVLDIWGKLSDEKQALHFLAEQKQYDVQHAKRALIAQSSHLWLQHMEKTNRQKKMELLLSFYRKNLAHYQRSYIIGLSDFDSYMQAKNRFIEYQVRLKYTQLETLETKQILNILRGQTPNAHLSLGEFSFSKYSLSLPQKINATLLVNRPDILAAFSQAKAFDYTARSAYKAMLPQLGLSGESSLSDRSLKQALNDDVVWQLVGGIAQPIFRGGQLLANARQKSAEAEANWWQYQARVLKAMEEVESTLNQERGLSYQVVQEQKILNNQSRLLSTTAEQFSHGNVALPQYLMAQMDKIESEIRLMEAYFKYLKNRLTLMQALGVPFKHINT